jgi:hypothetical protein
MGVQGGIVVDITGDMSYSRENPFPEAEEVDKETVMSENGVERRTCLRFEIPGATVSYKISKLLPSALEKYLEEFCPLIDISRGGLRFRTNQMLEIDTKLQMHVFVPGERGALVLKGRVRWAASQQAAGYAYEVGAQFNPYGEKKDQNYPGNLVKIIALEQKFCPPDSSSQPPQDDGDYEVDG